MLATIVWENLSFAAAYVLGFVSGVVATIRIMKAVVSSSRQ